MDEDSMSDGQWARTSQGRSAGWRGRGPCVTARRRERVGVDSMRSAAKLSRILLAAVLVASAIGTARGQSAPPPGAWTEKDPPRGWVIVRTANFEVQAEIAEPRARRLAQFLQGLRSQFEALWPPGRKPVPQVVKVFA